MAANRLPGLTVLEFISHEKPTSSDEDIVRDQRVKFVPFINVGMNSPFLLDGALDWLWMKSVIACVFYWLDGWVFIFDDRDKSLLSLDPGEREAESPHNVDVYCISAFNQDT